MLCTFNIPYAPPTQTRRLLSRSIIMPIHNRWLRFLAKDAVDGRSHQANADTLCVFQFNVPLDLFGSTGIADRLCQRPSPEINASNEDEPRPRGRDDERDGVQRQEKDQESQVPHTGDDERHLRSSEQRKRKQTRRGVRGLSD